MLQFHPRLLFLVSVSPIVGCCSSFHLLVLFHCSTMIVVELFHKAPKVGAAVDVLEDRNVASEPFRSFRSPVGNLHSLLQWMLPFKDLTQMVLDLHGHFAASLEARVFEGVYQGCKPSMLRSSDLLTARDKRPMLLMVIFGITGTVGAPATWMLRSVAILNVKGVRFVHRCWSKTTAEVKQKNVDIQKAARQTVEFFKPCKTKCCHTRPQSCWIRHVEEVYDIEITLKYCVSVLFIYSMLKYRGSLWSSSCCQPLLTPWLKSMYVCVCMPRTMFARCARARTLTRMLQ